jgi:hypothetical protein
MPLEIDNISLDGNITGTTLYFNTVSAGTVSATTMVVNNIIYNTTIPASANTYTTGFTYNNNVFSLTNNTGGTLSVIVNSMTGLTINGVLSANTIFSAGTNVYNIFKKVGNQYTASTASTTTSSLTDVVINSMSLTLLQGDYDILFDSYYDMNTATSRITDFSCYLNGVQIPTSIRRYFTTDSSAPTSVSICFKLTGVTNNQVLDVRWKVAGNTATIYQRTLTATKIN